jgi:GH15 family glucan-1,4-alpha-glucosidase
VCRDSTATPSSAPSCKTLRRFCDEARDLFEQVLARRNRHGLLSEHVDPQTGEPWGNFVQTYSMVGIIRSAMRLSLPWDQAF